MKVYRTTADDLKIQVENVYSGQPYVADNNPNPQPPDNLHNWILASSAVHNDRVLWFWYREI